MLYGDAHLATCILYIHKYLAALDYIRITTYVKQKEYTTKQISIIKLTNPRMDREILTEGNCRLELPLEKAVEVGKVMQEFTRNTTAYSTYSLMPVSPPPF